MHLKKIFWLLLIIILIFTFCNNTENQNAKITNNDSIDWIIIQDSISEISLKDFLAKYPNGNYSNLAKQKLEELENEKKAWIELKTCHSLKKCKIFIENFPNGFYLDSANNIIAELEKLTSKEFLEKYSPNIKNFVNFIDTLNYNYPYEWFDDFWIFVKGNELEYYDTEIETLQISKNEVIGSYHRKILSDFLEKLKDGINNNFQLEICEKNEGGKMIYYIYLNCISIEYLESNGKIYIISLFLDTRC